MTLSATSCETARAGFIWRTEHAAARRPHRSTACGSWRMPRAARVAYADVISSGLTACVPSVIEHTGWSRERIPSRCAIRTTAGGPTRVTSCAKIVFTELRRRVDEVHVAGRLVRVVVDVPRLVVRRAAPSAITIAGGPL